MSDAPNRRKRRQPFLISGLVALVLVLFWLDLNAGYRSMSLQELWGLMTGQASPALRLTIVGFRLPRILMALLVGVGLSASGCLLQGVSRNELADPGVLGINAGAGLMVALFMVLFGQGMQGVSLGIPAAAFLGALATGACVYALAGERTGGPHSARLVLTGIAVASALNAFTIMLLLLMRQDEYGFIAGWLAGNIWGASWENLRLLAPWMAALLLLALYRANALNALGLGQQSAVGLGVNVRRESLTLLAAAVGLSSACVAVGGGISFVGLICPHIARKLAGSRHQILLPVAVLIGAALMLLSDMISRTLIAPHEIPIGVTATVIGTPYFLYLLVNKRR